MQVFRIILLSFLFSCKQLPNSQGLDNQIVIISSDEDKEYVNLYLNQIFNVYINTPFEENIYEIIWASTEDFSKYKYYKNIIINSLKFPKDESIDLLYNKFHSQYVESDIFSLIDLYANGQVIIFLGSHDSIEYEKNINIHSMWIKEEIDTNISSNVYKKIKNKDINIEIISIIQNKFNIDINIDNDYQIIKNSDNFLWIGRGFPYRWIMVSSIKKSNLNYWNSYEENLYKNTNGIIISNYYRSNKNNYKYNILRGIYEHEESDTGGPFFVYVFDNKSDNEVILVSGFVNNPGKEKYLLLKELEVIIENIKRK